MKAVVYEGPRGQVVRMIARRVLGSFGPAVITAWGLSASVVSGLAVPPASAAPCPDTEVVFARGTGEPPGVGPTGQAFLDTLGSRIGGRSMGSTRSTIQPATSGPPASTASEMPERTSFRWPVAVPRPRSCSVATHKVLP